MHIHNKVASEAATGIYSNIERRRVLIRRKERRMRAYICENFSENVSGGG